MSIEKRYQVFVSSTFADLHDERQQVIQALLELDCIPSGMELFPAANDDQWTLIKGVIDDCDYYLVIVAGRYGSVASDGLSYTEKEYRYAAERAKPIIAFLHDNPDNIPAGKSEQNADSKPKLSEFRELCKKKMCKTWSSAADLGGKVSRSLIHLIKTNPAIGWVRGDEVPNEGVERTINRLRDENDKLQKELLRVRMEAPKEAASLAQGHEPFIVRYTYRKPPMDSREFGNLEWSWNTIFAMLAPCMIREGSDFHLRDRLQEEIMKGHEDDILNRFQVEVDSGDFHKILVQLRALGLITPSQERRSVKDRGITYWSLTPYGDEYMNRLLAIPAYKPVSE